MIFNFHKTRLNSGLEREKTPRTPRPRHSPVAGRPRTGCEIFVRGLTLNESALACLSAIHFQERGFVIFNKEEDCETLLSCLNAGSLCRKQECSDARTACLASGEWMRLRRDEMRAAQRWVRSFMRIQRENARRLAADCKKAKRAASLVQLRDHGTSNDVQKKLFGKKERILQERKSETQKKTGASGDSPAPVSFALAFVFAAFVFGGEDAAIGITSCRRRCEAGKGTC